MRYGLRRSVLPLVCAGAAACQSGQIFRAGMYNCAYSRGGVVLGDSVFSFTIYADPYTEYVDARNNRTLDLIRGGVGSRTQHLVSGDDSIPFGPPPALSEHVKKTMLLPQRIERASLAGQRLQTFFVRGRAACDDERMARYRPKRQNGMKGRAGWPLG